MDSKQPYTHLAECSKEAPERERNYDVPPNDPLRRDRRCRRGKCHAGRPRQ